MKLKLYRKNNGWYSAILRGRGGMSSMVYSRIGKFWFVIGTFVKFKYLWRGLTW